MALTYQRAYSPSSLAVSIADMPAELLLLIFKFLYMESRISEYGWLDEFFRADEEENGRPYETVWPESDDILSPALFPQAPASVSKVWRNVLSTFPPFWTRVIIFADSPLSFSRSQLEWSRELLIDITVITRKSRLPLSPDMEKMRMRQIIEMVTPHVCRCKTLRYDVTYTSSLPRIATDFPLFAPYLHRLILKASLGNGLPGFLDGSEVSGFPFPKIQVLKIDGWNFVDLFKHTQWWFEVLLKATPKSLSISHYRPTNNEDRFLLLDAFPFFHKFDRLSLKNVYFDCSSNHTSFNDDPFHGSLKLCGLSGRLTATMLHQRSAEFLTIARCPLTGVTSFPPCELVLRDIDDPDMSLDLRVILPTWRGLELIVQNCPGFDDGVLDILSETHITATGQETLNSPKLHTLSIKNCQGFSIMALRGMTEARQAYIADADSHDADFDLDDFTVKVLQVSPLEEEDRQWFKRHFGETSLSDHDQELWQRTGIRPEI